MDMYSFLCSTKEEGFLNMISFLNEKNAEYVAHEFSEDSILFVYKKAT